MPEFASFSVIRYVADPARNEQLNIGVLVWTADDWRLSVDDAAVARVVRENPHLERESLLQLESILGERLMAATGTLPARIENLLATQRGFPVVLTDHNRTTLVGDGLDDLTEELISRVVRPRRRTSGGGGPDPLQAVAREVKPLISNRIVERHRSVHGSVSGIPRLVDFFANHGSNVALDVVRLAVKQADEVRRRADAEAFKIYDIIQGVEVSTFFALCMFSTEETLRTTNGQAKQVIEAAGAKVLTTVEDASRALGTDALKLLPSMDE